MGTTVTLTRKAKHETCDIRRAAHVTNISISRIQKALDETGKFETKLYLVTKVNAPTPDEYTESDKRVRKGFNPLVEK